MKKIFFPVLVIMCLAYSASMAGTFEDLRGRFVMDLPEGWQLTPQTDDKVYVFKREADSIIIEYVPNTSDSDKLFQKAVATLHSSGLKGATPQGDLKSLSVNGNPARWGLYQSEMEVQKTKVVLFSRLGCVSLKDHGLYFMSIFGQEKKDQLSGPLEKAFHSIRSPGQSATGPSDEKAVALKTAPAVPVAWQHECVSLMLPPGWKEKPKLQNFEKEVIGWFAHEQSGGQLIVLCYQGFGMNEVKALKAAKETVEISIPDAKPVNLNELELDGKKAPVISYQGTSVSRGTEVQLTAVTSTLKAGKCYLDLIGIVAAGGLEEMEKDIIAITRSAK